jgi:hypothetical protein
MPASSAAGNPSVELLLAGGSNVISPAACAAAPAADPPWLVAALAKSAAITAVMFPALMLGLSPVHG